MKVFLERDELLKAMAQLHRVVERRNAIPIIGNVLLRSSESVLQLKTTNFELEMSQTIPASVESSGGITVPAVVFYELIRKLPEGIPLSFEKESRAESGERLVIAARRARYSFQALPEQDFPEIESSHFSHSFKLAVPVLRAMFERTLFSIATEETRPYLGGVYMHVAPKEEGAAVLRCVATDGHRLAQASCPAPPGAEGMPGIIIPRKTVAEARRVLSTMGGDTFLTLAVSETKCRLTMGHVILTSKVIDGSFPDYARVIPKNNSKRVEVNGANLMRAIDRVATLASDQGRVIKVTVEPGRVEVSVENLQSGAALEDVEALYEQERFSMGFNAKYLLDVLSQLSEEKACFFFGAPNAPVLIQEAPRGEGVLEKGQESQEKEQGEQKEKGEKAQQNSERLPADLQFLYVLMPMRL